MLAIYSILPTNTDPASPNDGHNIDKYSRIGQNRHERKVQDRKGEEQTGQDRKRHKRREHDRIGRYGQKKAQEERSG